MSGDGGRGRAVRGTQTTEGGKAETAGGPRCPSLGKARVLAAAQRKRSTGRRRLGRNLRKAAAQSQNR